MNGKTGTSQFLFLLNEVLTLTSEVPSFGLVFHSREIFFEFNV